VGLWRVSGANTMPNGVGMTEKMRDAAAKERPWIGTALLALYSTILAFIVFALGWQWQIYSDHKKDIKEALDKQNAAIAALTTRQDIIRQRQETLQADNYSQDQRISREFVTLERYSCDLKDLKDTMKEGFSRITKQVDEFNKRK
jgi:hypothetical protein